MLIGVFIAIRYKDVFSSDITMWEHCLIVFFSPLMPIVIMAKRTSIENEASDIVYNWALSGDPSSPSEIFFTYQGRLE